MATIRLPSDFKEFLNSLNSNDVRYLLVGGYAVGFHGHPRATADLDVWVSPAADNAAKLAAALRKFGFDPKQFGDGVLTKPKQIVRMGRPPLRIEILTTVSGVEFDACFQRRIRGNIDGVDVTVISLSDLRENKRAAGRHGDLRDLEGLPHSDAS